VSTAFAAFSGTRSHSAHDSVNAGARSLGRGLLRIPARLQRWAQRQEEQRQLAALSLHLLDDVGLTPADRDAMLG
jgi:uncharacterized protein YjiS (DUF1127 family)